MHITLITPRFHGRYFWDFRKLRQLLGRRANNLQLALPTVAALTPPEHELTLVDDNINPPDYDAPVDLVGLTAMTCYANRAFEIADEYRRRGVPVVIGGPHATLAPFETLEHADAVVLGEAENVWEGLLEDFARGQMKEVYRGIDVRPDLQSNPPPRWDLVESRNYVFYGVEATRGCPFDCHFCTVKQIYGPTYRHRTVKEVVDECRAAPNNQIFFTDDNLIGNKKFARELFAALKGAGISWGCQMSINIGSMPELLQTMKDAGCFFVFIGFETLHKEGVEEFNKPVNRLDYFRAIRNIQEMGIHVIGSFIIGGDRDTPETAREIAEFTQESGLSWVMVNILNSPAGTQMMRSMEEQGRNFVYSYNELDGAHATVKHPSMTRDEIESSFRWLYRTVYDWDKMRERLTASLDKGGWSQNSLTLSIREQAGVFARLCWDYLARGSWAQRRFFLAVMARMGRKANRNSIINVLLLATCWNDFAQDLRPLAPRTGEVIRFRPEYMVPVDQQPIGLDGAVARPLAAMDRRRIAASTAIPPINVALHGPGG